MYRLGISVVKVLAVLINEVPSSDPCLETFHYIGENLFNSDLHLQRILYFMLKFHMYKILFPSYLL